MIIPVELLDASLWLAGAWLVVGFAAVLVPHRSLFAAGALVGLLLAGVALVALFAPAATRVLPLGLPDLPFHLRLDALASFFLFILGAVAAGVSVYAVGYFASETAERLRLISLQYHVFLASMAFVILADDAYLFMVAWETMALSSYFLVIIDHE
jgi:hydrogenase-4 component B